MKQFRHHSVENICKIPKVSRYIYQTLVGHLNVEVKSKVNWGNVIGKQLHEDDWQNIVTLPSKVTQDSKMRIFQYKILHRILPTNSLLHKYEIRDNPWCEHCPNVVDSLEHALHKCPRILSIWYEIANWLLPEVDLFQYVNTENIILGIQDDGSNLVNSIILAIKRYFYVNKCNNNQVSVNRAKLFLKQVQNWESNFRSVGVREKNRIKWLNIHNKLAII